MGLDHHGLTPPRPPDASVEATQKPADEEVGWWVGSGANMMVVRWRKGKDFGGHILGPARYWWKEFGSRILPGWITTCTCKHALRTHWRYCERLCFQLRAYIFALSPWERWITLPLGCAGWRCVVHVNSAKPFTFLLKGRICFIHPR